jgi:glutamyl-tRNA reductase
MDVNQFYIAGINYKKTDASMRGKFAVNPEQYALILCKAAQAGIRELFVLSTCNRTEIYGVAPDAETLMALLCAQTTGTAEDFSDLAYVKQGMDAIEHFFNVGAGLDSQILGDYEIVGQIKQSIKFSKEYGFVGSFLERLYNTVLQSSKAIKGETQLSGGTVSVSFAAIQFLKERLENPSEKKIILLGTGKIGRNTCKNLVDYLGCQHITLINRTDEKAATLAGELGLQYALYNDLKQQVQEADVVIVATHAEEPVIAKATLEKSKRKILIDLSIPNNIDPSAKDLAHITLVNVDDLSRINDETLQKRLNEVPRAKEIIVTHIQEFTEWCGMRRHVPALKAARQKLMELQQCGLFLATHPHIAETDIDEHSETVQKVINNMALRMRKQQLPGCSYIEAINDFITVRVN